MKFDDYILDYVKKNYELVIDNRGYRVNYYFMPKNSVKQLYDELYFKIVLHTIFSCDPMLIGKKIRGYSERHKLDVDEYVKSFMDKCYMVLGRNSWELMLGRQTVTHKYFITQLLSDTRTSAVNIEKSSYIKDLFDDHFKRKVEIATHHMMGIKD